MGAFDNIKLQGREKRLGTLSAYTGSAHNLLIREDDTQNIRTFSQGTYDEIIYSFQALNKVEESVIIIHGPEGCSSIEINDEVNFYVTNLNERDTILGGEEKLRETVYAAYKKHNPKVIFVISTPVVAINNDDISAVVLELEDEIETKIIPIYADGFKSKTAINGYDLIFHAIGRYLLRNLEKDKKENYLNLISLSESAGDLKEVLKIIKALNVNINVVPKYSNLEGLKKVVSGKATIALNDDEGYFLGTALENEYDVPFIKTNLPIGLKNTEKFIEVISEIFGKSEDIHKLFKKEKYFFENLINKKPLKNLKIYIDLKTSKAIALASLIKELGGEVIGITIDEVDEINRKKLETLKYDIDIHVASGQIFETANILNDLKPSIYIGEVGKTSWVSQYGIIPITIDNIVIYGFNGGKNLVSVINKALKNKKLIDNIANNSDEFYKKTWLKKSKNWYIKQEVK